ncbi:MAG: hypothetical protein AAF968_16885 [Pseudomonadota bacterium]
MSRSTSNDSPSAIPRQKKVRVIAGKSLDEWREFARRDDCLGRMVPSDLRQLIGAIPPAE